MLRGWLYCGNRGGSCAKFELNWWTRFCFLQFEFDDEDGWGFSIALPPVAFWLHINLPWRLKRDRTIGIRFHSGAVWWTCWVDDNEWNSRRPKWRQGSLNFVDFLLGRAKCTTTVLEERSVLVPMPERAYPALAKLMLYEWKRPRWFALRRKRVQIDIEEGIPFEGKGESSWNCGPDATYSITTGECSGIPEGVGILVGSVLRSRVKYGGWRDWSWQRQTEAAE